MFKNIDIPIDSIPRLEDHNFESLDKKYRLVMVIYASLFTLVLIGGTVALYFFNINLFETIKVPILVIILILIFWKFYVSFVGFSRKQYKLRQKDIIFKKGIWFRSETSVPFVRVQHSEVIQGPVERIFKLSKLKIYTAGGHSSDLSIPGLKPEIAEMLKDFVTRALVNEEEE